MSDETLDGGTAEPNPVLRRLDALVGEWEIETSVDGRSLKGGRTAFDWLEDGAFLVQRADAADLSGAPAEWVENSPLPLLTIIGLDDSSERFTGTLSDDGDTITSRWETSIDGSSWERDFDLTYTRVR